MADGLLLLGDLAPGRASLDLLMKGQGSTVLGDVQPLVQRAEIVIVNLEAPICDGNTASSKSGPSLRIPPEAVPGLVSLGIDHCSLANNHVMDFGAEGLRQTMQALDDAGLTHSGAGVTQADAARGHEFISGQRRFGLISVSAHEFGLAGPECPGVNPMDPVFVVPQLIDMRARVDHLVVLVHAGNESHPYPNPWLQSYCRMLVECGADVVSCQHSHIAGCMENWQQATILYGQGNFLLDLPTSTPDHYRQGLGVSLRPVDDSSSLQVTLHPLMQNRATGCLSAMNPDQHREFMNSFEARSARVGDPELLEQSWLDFTSRNATRYRSQLFVKHPLAAALIRKLGLGRLLRSRRRDLLVQNLVRCQDHREAIITILERGQ